MCMCIHVQNTIFGSVAAKNSFIFEKEGNYFALEGVSNPNTMNNFVHEYICMHAFRKHTKRYEVIDRNIQEQLLGLLAQYCKLSANVMRVLPTECIIWTF